jgi:tetratricopeptide (TPR) repeat protein
MAAHYAENTVHEKPEHLISLGRCLAEWSEGDDSEEGRQRARDALVALDRVTERFSADENACLSSLLIQARVHVGQGEREKAEDVLYKVECTQDQEQELNAGTSLEFARTLYALGHRERAEKMLIELSARYAEDPVIMAQVESLLDEPEGMEARIRAKELNRSGIQLFEQGQHREALDAFRAAIAFTPRHAALNLNLVQVALKLFKETGDADYLATANDALAQIRHIPSQHQQYKRMNHLIKQVGRLENPNEASSGTDMPTDTGAPE